MATLANALCCFFVVVFLSCVIELKTYSLILSVCLAPLDVIVLCCVDSAQGGRRVSSDALGGG